MGKDTWGILLLFANITVNRGLSQKVAVIGNEIGKIMSESHPKGGFNPLQSKGFRTNWEMQCVLEQKDSIAAFILEQLRSKQKMLYIEFLDAGLKDIILPGEIRDIMNTVLVAEKNAQANVIARREEVASTRSLLNTAKLMEENTTLYKLKEFEYLEKICDKVGSISVGGGNLLTELREILASR